MGGVLQGVVTVTAQLASQRGNFGQLPHHTTPAARPSRLQTHHSTFSSPSLPFFPSHHHLSLPHPPPSCSPAHHIQITMLSRSIASSRPAVVRSAARRAFSTSEVSGVSVSVREDLRPVSKVSVVVNAGSRYNSTPGVSHVLEKFAFKNTSKRSALRLFRESELLGGQLSTSISREQIVLTTAFLREDLPYFVEALADTTQNGLYKKYELAEDVAPIAIGESQAAYSSPAYAAEQAAYEVAFRSGLGNSVLVEPFSSVSVNQVAAYAKEAYTKANVSIAATNVVEADLKALVEEHFTALPSGSALTSPASKVYGGESRVKAAGASALTLLFPSTSTSAASAVLANLLGGSASSIKWSTGTSLLGAVAGKTGATIATSYTPYSDASALSITISSADAAAVAEAATLVAAEIKSIAAGAAAESVSKAVALTKFSQAAASEAAIPVLYALDVATVTPEAVAEAASALASGPIALAAVGKVHSLPYADELF